MNNPRKKERRWHLLADLPVQGQFCVRVMVYWFLSLSVFVGTIAGFSVLTNSSSSETLRLLVPGLIVSLLVLPFALLDMIQLTNRVAGPMINLRSRLKRLLEESDADVNFKFRKNDFYQDVCDLLNELKDRSQAAAAGDSPFDEALEDPTPAQTTLSSRQSLPEFCEAGHEQ